MSPISINGDIGPRYKGEDDAIIPAYIDRDQTHPFLNEQSFADGGDKVAQYNMGVRHLYGWEVQQNDEKARQYIHLSAEQGYADAEHAYGLMLALGRCGVTRDWDKAFRYVTNAADQGLAEAQKTATTLAYMYCSKLAPEEFYQKALREMNGMSDESAMHRDIDTLLRGLPPDVLRAVLLKSISLES
jgi:TPR repeat protein